MDGALYWASGIDNTGMYRDADETKRIIDSITKTVKAAGVAMGAVFGATTLAQFGRQIVNVRGEMQMLEKSFETLLGGKSASAKLLGEIKQFAIESPLSITGISKAEQTLLGFNVEAEKTIPILKQIGDISMGDEQRFQSLTLAFAQMSSTGKLMGQDLLQMINAGFNPLVEMSRKTGKSIADLKSEMEKGAISSEMVADAFRSATSEGGKFYGMAKKQAEGIKGLQAQIQGSIQEMMNNIGKSSEGFVTTAYKGVKDLIDNYEKVGRILASLVVTYGAYRAAVVAVTVAEKGWTIASMAQYKWLLLVEKAQKLLNVTMMKNPYVAVAVAVFGLVSALWALRDRTTAQEKVQKRLNDTLEEAKGKKEALKSKGSELISVMNDETQTIFRQVKAYKELIELLPALKGKSLKELQMTDAGDLAKMLNQKADEDERSEIEKKYKEAISRSKIYEHLLFEEKRSKQSSAYAIEAISKNIEEAKIEADSYKKKLEEIAQIEKEANAHKEEKVIKNKEYWEKRKKEAEDARAKMDTSEKESEEWKKLSKQIEDANNELEKYSDKKSGLNEKKKTDDGISKAILDSEIALSNARIELMKDGKNKRLKQSEQDHKENLARIDREEAELLAKYKEQGKAMQDDVKKSFSDRRSENDALKKKRDTKIDKEYAEEFENRIKEMTGILFSEEARRREEIKKRYDEERKWAKEQLEGGSISQEQYVKYISIIDESEAKEQRDRLLAGLNDFKAQEESIHKKWDAKIAEAATSGDEELLNRLTEGRAKALGELNAQMLMQTDEWRMLFENMDTLTAEQIQKLAKTIRDKAKELKLDPANLEAIMKRLREADNQIRTKNPFLALANSIKKYKKAENEAAKGESVRKIAQNTSSALEQVGGIFNSITDGLKKMGMAGDEETQKLLSHVGDMVGGAATLAKGIATSNPADIITGGVQLLTSAIEVFDNKSREANRTIKHNKEQLEKLKIAYEDLERAINKTYSTKAANLLEDEKRNLDTQRRNVQDMVRAEKRKKKPDKKVIEEYNKLLKDIDNRISETNDRITESLAGKDVKSAIDEIAQAYANAFESGEKAAKKSADVVRGILKNALINYMKSQLQPEVDNLMKKIADSMKDGKISDAEQSAIDALLNALNDKASQYEESLKPYLDKDKNRSGVTGELKREMTEGTASQLVGLWNMTAMDIRTMKEFLINNPMPNVAKELNSLLNEMHSINQNTREAAGNTRYLETGLRRLEDKLEEIKRNTKPNNSRG